MGDTPKSNQPERRAVPPASSYTAMRTMKANRAKETGPEVALRSHLHRRGLRFRKNLRVRGEGRTVSVDVLFPKAKIAVFVDGCFWHGCPQHMTWPKSNAEWWRNKIDTNRKRDRAQTASLKAAGWTVIRIWEHEDPADAADLIAAVVSKSNAARPSTLADRR